MLTFQNPGLIDLRAVTTLGVSVKKPGSFGRFGTGLKFAIATILRGGGSIRLYRGLEEHVFSSLDEEITGKEFQIVQLDGVSMGITTQLGRDWQPWMVLRELGCNALDELGRFGHADIGPLEECTTIVVEWDGLEEAFKERHELFLEGTPLYQDRNIRILPGAAKYIFYRGVRVFTLEKPTLFTYDIIEEQSLTEDRTLPGTYLFNQLLADTVAKLENKAILDPIITAGEASYESKLDFQCLSWGVTVDRPFLEVAIKAREEKQTLNPTAKKILQQHTRRASSSSGFFGGYGYASYRAVADMPWDYAIAELKKLGVAFAPGQDFVSVGELPGEALSMCEDGRLYIHHSLQRKSAREIALELLRRWVELKGADDSDAVVDLLGPLLVDQLPTLKRDEALVKEDEVEAKIEESHEMLDELKEATDAADLIPF